MSAVDSTCQIRHGPLPSCRRAEPGGGGGGGRRSWLDATRQHPRLGQADQALVTVTSTALPVLPPNLEPWLSGPHWSSRRAGAFSPARRRRLGPADGDQRRGWWQQAGAELSQKAQLSSSRRPGLFRHQGRCHGLGQGGQGDVGEHGYRQILRGGCLWGPSSSRSTWRADWAYSSRLEGHWHDPGGPGPTMAGGRGTCGFPGFARQAAPSGFVGQKDTAATDTGQKCA